MVAMEDLMFPPRPGLPEAWAAQPLAEKGAGTRRILTATATQATPVRAYRPPDFPLSVGGKWHFVELHRVVIARSDAGTSGESCIIVFHCFSARHFFRCLPWPLLRRRLRRRSRKASRRRRPRRRPPDQLRTRATNMAMTKTRLSSPARALFRARSSAIFPRKTRSILATFGPRA